MNQLLLLCNSVGHQKEERTNDEISNHFSTFKHTFNGFSQ